MNPIGLLFFILYWIFPVLVVVYALVGFLAWLLATIQRDGLPETILNGFGLLILIFAASGIVKVFLFPFFE